jgi:hypothetical protein
MIYYLDYFDGNFGFLLREKEPNNLREAQEMAFKVENNWKTSGKGDLHVLVREKV